MAAESIFPQIQTENIFARMGFAFAGVFLLAVALYEGSNVYHAWKESKRMRYWDDMKEYAKEINEIQFLSPK